MSGLNDRLRIAMEAPDGMKVAYERLKEVTVEMYPYVVDSCPEECRYRSECEGEGNRGSDGLPLQCVAGRHIAEKLRELRIEVSA